MNNLAICCIALCSTPFLYGMEDNKKQLCDAAAQKLILTAQHSSPQTTKSTPPVATTQDNTDHSFFDISHKPSTPPNTPNQTLIKRNNGNPPEDTTDWVSYVTNGISYAASAFNPNPHARKEERTLAGQMVRKLMKGSDRSLRLGIAGLGDASEKTETSRVLQEMTRKLASGIQPNSNEINMFTQRQEIATSFALEFGCTLRTLSQNEQPDSNDILFTKDQITNATRLLTIHKGRTLSPLIVTFLERSVKDARTYLKPFLLAQQEEILGTKSESTDTDDNE